MIYTSNYARKGTDPNAVSISRRPPDWFEGLHLVELAPTWDMIRGVKEGHLTQKQYTELYIDILERHTLNWADWLNRWPDPTYFLCYETPTDFCHRHIFSAWVGRKFGIIIPEWKNPKEQEAAKQQEVVDELLQF